MIDLNLYLYMNEMASHAKALSFQRYMYEKIDWNARMVGVVGPRGVGKSTMLLQRLNEIGGDAKQLYVSADHTYFANHTLADLADEFVKEGGTHLYIDEVHKYKGWSRELKQMYDVHPSLRIIFTGSSILDIFRGEADLSRRALIYEMQGLSFREYLCLFKNIETRAYTLEEILAHKVKVDGLEHPLPLFRDYCARGYYPFAIEGSFEIRIEQIVSQTIEADIPQYADMKVATARKLKRLLAIIATLAPFKPSSEALASEIGVSKNNIPDYLYWLQKAGMIGLLRDDTSGMRGLGKVEKAYIDNPSLMTALSGAQPNIGNLRETFFYNQMRVNNIVTSSKASDFVIGKYTFEVGGEKKGHKQIEGIPNGIVVKDGIERGHGDIVPLWQFGFNY